MLFGLKDKKSDFEKVAMEHLEAIYNFAFKLTGSRQDAEDLVQDTYLKAYRFFSQFKRGTNFKSWLFKIMHNTFISKYRKDIKKPAHLDFDDIEFKSERLLTGFTTTDDAQLEEIFNGLVDDEVSSALDKLPDEYKQVILLFDIHNFNYQEIAHILNCPIGTVRSRIHRGRKMLRESLMNYAKKRGVQV
jgi:RNA polymerase sigma-70 factor (ECF subfamily)